MKYSYHSNKNIEIIDKTLSQAIKLTAKSSCFDMIRSILVNTDIEKPPHSFLEVR